MPFLAAIPAIAGIGSALGGAAGIASAAGGVIGAVAGAIPKGSSSNTIRNVGGMSDLEMQGGQAQGQALGQLGDFTAAGPGLSDVQAGSQSSRDLASMLQQYSQGGNIPGAADISAGNTFASRAFQPQRVGIEQNFQEAQQQYAQQAELQGRNTLDPVFRNKQNVEKQRQLQMLGAQQGQFANQFAMQQPEQRLNYAGQRAQVLGGLASQAMSNRQALFNMGNQLKGQEQNFRLGAAGSTTQGQSGGGFGEALAGGLAGFGGGLKLANQFGGPNSPAQQNKMQSFAQAYKDWG